MNNKHHLIVLYHQKLKRWLLICLMMVTPILTLISPTLFVPMGNSRKVQAAGINFSGLAEGNSCVDILGNHHFPLSYEQGLDVILYIDESYSAGVDTFRQDIAHLLVEYLLADSIVRNTTHRISIWAFSEEVVTLTDRWRLISENQIDIIDDIHQDIANKYEDLYRNYSPLGSVGITNLQLVIDEAVSLVVEEDSGRIPTVLILSDMDTAIGRSGQARQEDIAALYRAWEPVLENAYLYILAFETGNKDLRDWFNTEILEKLEGRGGLREINDKNKLLVLQGILREATRPGEEQMGSSPFDWFSSQQLQTRISPHAEKVIFAFIRNTPDVDVFAPSPLNQSGEASELRANSTEFRYAIIFEQNTPFADHQWQMERMGTGQDVLFAIKEYGGLQFSFNDNEQYVLAGDTISIQAGKFDTDNKLNEIEPILIWREENGFVEHREQPRSVDDIYSWVLESPSVSKPTNYILQIPEYDVDECLFTIVPRPYLRLERPQYDGTIIEVTVFVEYFERFGLTEDGRETTPIIYLSQGETVSLTEPITSEVIGPSLRLNYVFTPTMLFDIEFDSALEWHIKAELVGKTQEGFNIHTDVHQSINENIQVITLTPTPSPPIPTPMITMSLKISSSETITSYSFQETLNGSQVITNGNINLTLESSDGVAYNISVTQPERAVYLPDSVIRGLVALLLVLLIFIVVFTLLPHRKFFRGNSTNLLSDDLARQQAPEPTKDGTP